MKFIRRYTLIVTATLFTLTAMAVMLLFFSNRDVEAETLYLTSGSEPDGDTWKEREGGAELKEEETASSLEGYLCIPLDEGVGENDVEISYDATGKTMSVKIPVKTGDFYYQNNLYGSRDHISSIEFRDLGSEVIFDIKNDDKMVPETLFENSTLCISFKPMIELYDRVIAVDAGHGGEDSGTEAYDIIEKDITLGIVKELENIAVQDAGIFFTRTEDEGLSDEEREKKAESLGADIIISLHTNADKDTRITRGMEIYYSDDSVEDVAKSLSAGLRGVSGVEDVSVVKKKDTGFFDRTDIPCIVVRLGYMTNKAEAEMMNDKEFQKQTAEAIASVIVDN